MASSHLEQHSCTPSDHPGPDVIPPLLTLPETALAQIYQCSFRNHEHRERGHPLLPVSSGCRDMVLSIIRRIALDPSSPVSVSKLRKPLEACDPAPWARLLHRACCQATPGLTVQLCLTCIRDSLPELLQPGIDCGGWSKVHSLEVIGASCGTHLIPHAFPALHTLKLIGTKLGDGALFSQLAAQPSPSLTSLHLVDCSIDSGGVQHAAAALGQLASLQAVRLDEPEPTGIAGHLTGLTSLSIRTDGQAVLGEQQAAVAAQNQGLRSLALLCDRYPERKLQPDLLRQVLTSCTRLTQLDLHNLVVDDQGLEVLLTHGTSITDLTLGKSRLTASKADRACSWRRLVLGYGTLQEYAYLPLKSVQLLQEVRRRPAPVVELDLPFDVPAAQPPDLLHQATTNLASCPAWAKAPPSQLTLSGYPQGLTSAQRVQLLDALAPVAGRHVRELRLGVRVQLGGAEVEALAASFAGSLKSLHLDSATLLDSFWTPLAQRFPNLQQLCLGRDIKAGVTSLAMYLATFSCSASHVLDVSIECFGEEEAEQLQSSADAWSLENIRLHVEPDTEVDDG